MAFLNHLTTQPFCFDHQFTTPASPHPFPLLPDELWETHLSLAWREV